MPISDDDFTRKWYALCRNTDERTRGHTGWLMKARGNDLAAILTKQQPTIVCAYGLGMNFNHWLVRYGTGGSRTGLYFEFNREFVPA